MSGPPTSFADVESYRHLIDICVMDSLVRNLDRAIEGNTLLVATRNEGADASEVIFEGRVEQQHVMTGFLRAALALHARTANTVVPEKSVSSWRKV